MADDRRNPGEELASIPFGDLIYSVAAAIAEGQLKLDQSALQVAELMGGHPLLRDSGTGELLTREGKVTAEAHTGDTRIYFGYTYDENGQRQPNLVSMMELGFIPTFYQFVDTVIELKIAVRLRRSDVSGVATSGAASTQRSSRASSTRAVRGAARATVTATPVDARYRSEYSYDADLASTLTTKLVPVPPPPMLQERIRAMIEQETADRERAAEKAKERASRSLATQPLDEQARFETACYRIEEPARAARLVTAAFTVEAWIKPDSSRASNVYTGLFLRSNAGGWLLGATDRRFGFALSTGRSPQTTLLDAGEDYAPQKWHHVAGVYDGAEMRLYVDGVLKNGSTEQTGAVAGSDSARFTIGGSPTPPITAPFSGQIDEVRVWDQALDGARIKRDMTYRLKGAEAGLVGYWRVDKATDDAIPDAVVRPNSGERLDAKRVLLADISDEA